MNYVSKRDEVIQLIATKVGVPDSNLHWNTIYSPNQTHSISPINKDMVPKVKEELKKLGICKFRQVTLTDIKGCVILCFNATDYFNQ